MDKGSEKFGDGLLMVESGLGQITSCVEQSGNTEIVGVKADQKPGGDEMITVAKQDAVDISERSGECWKGLCSEVS